RLGGVRALGAPGVPGLHRQPVRGVPAARDRRLRRGDLRGAGLGGGARPLADPHAPRGPGLAARPRAGGERAVAAGVRGARGGRLRRRPGRRGPGVPRAARAPAGRRRPGSLTRAPPDLPPAGPATPWPPASAARAAASPATTIVLARDLR